jgi:hypothetical protein
MICLSNKTGLCWDHPLVGILPNAIFVAFLFDREDGTSR